MKTFYCIHCRAERSIDMKLMAGRTVRCTVCEASRKRFKQTGVYDRSPYSKTVGHKQDSWSEDALPDHITESYAESVAE